MFVSQGEGVASSSAFVFLAPTSLKNDQSGIALDAGRRAWKAASQGSCCYMSRENVMQLNE